MAESAGKRLAHARHQRGLTIEEVAYATKLRPDKIVALENNDFAMFASNAYAKGFLKNYARYLDVDLSDFLDTFDSSMPITVADYQYLNNAPEPPRHTYTASRERKPPSIIPILAAVGILCFAMLGVWVYANAQRIFSQRTVPKSPVAEAVHADSALHTPAPELEGPPRPIEPGLVAVPPGLVAIPAPDPAPAPEEPAAEPPPVPVPDPEPAKPSLDHDTVTPTPVVIPEPVEQVAPENNEVLVASLKKTWVTVRKGDHKSPTIFADYVYPGKTPLKLKGPRFFIEARDPAAVQITKNGLPIAYQAPGVTVQ
jgi:cytoskeleton protein RodZ